MLFDDERPAFSTEGILVPRPTPTPETPQGLCLDAGDDDDAVREIVKELGFTPRIRPRGEAAEAIQREPGFKTRRGVVERTHRWMNRFRRLLVRWEKRDDTYLAMVHLALGIITWRATGLLR